MKDKLANKNLNLQTHPLLFIVCSSSEDSGHMVECEACSQWSHSKCVSIIPSLAPTYTYVCPFCIKSVFSQKLGLKSLIFGANFLPLSRPLTVMSLLLFSLKFSALMILFLKSQLNSVLIFPRLLSFPFCKSH